MKALLVTLLVLSSGSLRAADNLGGCYQLSMGPWDPTVAQADRQYATPPERIALTHKRERHPLAQGYMVTPANGAEASAHEFAYWHSENGHVYIAWSTGYAGVAMGLTPSGRNLEGTASTFWDFPHPLEKSHVRAERIACAARGRAELLP